jgi:hypothetical protein
MFEAPKRSQGGVLRITKSMVQDHYASVDSILKALKIA